ncbi:hypothetical protein WJX84_004062 [Apatococcus fuscideae]|uniref:N-acetyltransferase domain-containing protein n=1 Tax=Apatococcus fuscideae TaxID=2026836 RepID=A0AAW1TEJ9_9CHLO
MAAAVRLAALDDLDALTSYNMAMAHETEGLTLQQGILRKGIEALLTDRSKGQYFVVEAEGQVVAQLMITYEWSDWRNSRIWWIQSVYVHPDHRRKGLFKLLYDYVKELSLEERAAGLRLYADASNHRAQSTYKAMGMTTHYNVFEDMTE